MSSPPTTTYRRRCLEAKGEQCVICDTGENIEVHHVDGDRTNGELENLEPMCKDCHDNVHAGREGHEDWTAKLLEPPSEPVTERDHSTFYLHEDLSNELRRAWLEMQMSFIDEYGFEPEKNRHFRPLVLYLGAQKIKEMDTDEIASTLNTTDILDSIYHGRDEDDE